MITHGSTRTASARASVLCALLVVSACGRSDETAGHTAPVRTPVGVATEIVELREVADVYEAVGTVRARFGATIAAKVTAPILSVAVGAGSRVAAGQELARLDDRDLRAEYDRAAAEHRRVQALFAKQAATKAELEAAESRYRVAEATLSYATIGAPFAGTVTEKLCDAGDMAIPGKPLFVVEQTDAYRLETSIPERLIEALSLGMAVEVTLEAFRDGCRGTVGEIVPTADPSSRSFTVKVDLACPFAPRSGTFGRVRVRVGSHEELAISTAALHQRGQLRFVWVVEDERARMRIVKPGRAQEGLTEVLAGLDRGDHVVVIADGPLEDGVPVRVR